MPGPIGDMSARAESRIRGAFLLVLFLIFLSGCSRLWLRSVSPQDLPNSAKVLQAIALPPPTGEDQCGPQAVAAFLRHQGDRVDLDDIVRACSDPTAGTLLELSLIARERFRNEAGSSNTLQVSPCVCWHQEQRLVGIW